MSWPVIVALCAAGLLLVALMVRSALKEHAKQEARFDQATPASATIERVEQPGRSTSGDLTAVLKVHLSVTPPSGDPYPAITGMRLKQVDLPKAQEGERITVRIDAENPHMVFPDVEWAEMELVTITRAARAATSKTGA